MTEIEELIGQIKAVKENLDIEVEESQCTDKSWQELLDGKLVNPLVSFKG